MFTSIIVAVALDHGDAARGLIERAAKLVEPGGTIRALTVVEPIPAYVAAELPPDLMTGHMDQARETLDEVVKAAAPTVTVVPELRIGGPSAEILASAEEHGADLIIVASHKPGFSTYFIGSTAAKVVRHAQCSVLVLR